MAVKIQIKRGSKAGLPALAPGEYGLATDTNELFVGTASGNVQIATLGSDGKVPEGQLPEMDYVPTSRTVNGKALSSDITLTASDVGAQTALTFDTTPTAGSNNPVTSGGIKGYVDDAIDEATAGSLKLSEVEAAMPSSANWQSITYGEGKFVTVAYSNNKAAYSTDSINWTEATLPSSLRWQSVTYGNGKFVVVADAIVVLYSLNGINWFSDTMPSNEDWSSITFGNGKFVAVASDSNSAAYSTNATTWTAATLPSSAPWSSVAYGNGKFVAIAGSNSNKAAYSTDGISWTAATLPSSGNWSSVVYGGGKFVAVSTSDGVTRSYGAYSEDGISWTSTSIPNSFSSVAYGKGTFVAVGDSGAAAYSLNGESWITATMPSSANWSSVTYGDGKFVAVAYGSNEVAYSTDGITWLSTAQVLTDSAGDDVTDDVAQALGVSKIVTGSYTGTGTSGRNNPNTLTFPDTFTPKIVFIISSNISYLASPYCWGADRFGIYYIGSTTYSSSYYNLVTVSGNVMSWYFSNFSDGSEYQLNAQGKTYNYIAIG